MSAIQWYPGHMTKAVRNIQNEIKKVDLVIEIRDARIPGASSNPDIDRLTAGKNRVIVLNKADLADPVMTEGWAAELRKKGRETVILDSRNRSGINTLLHSVRLLSEEKRRKDREKGITGERPVRAMVCGIPNVGKSTLINTLTGRASMKTGNKPGVTKGDQWVSTDSALLLLDTPGILWPKFSDRETGYLLASIGSINDNILDPQEIAVYIIRKLNELYPGILAERYDLTDHEKENVLNSYERNIPGVDYDSLAVLDLIAEKRKCLRKGGLPDREKAAKIIIDDLRSGKIGQVTLEKP